MTSKKTLDLARQWAADINADRETLSQDTIDAAADLISSLPDEWVDADTLRNYISDWREGLDTDPRGNYEDEILDNLEALLPAPEPAAPRPEDVPEGETWLIRPYENADPASAFRVHASKYGPGKRWAYFRVGGSMIGFADDEDVTLIARLVPETTEQDTEPALSSDYLYRDKDGDEWGHIEGRWVNGDTHAERVARRGYGFGLASLPEGYGPYTRIKKEDE